MITAVLDTNVFLQALIGSPRSASVRTLKALDEGRYRLVFSPAAIDELFDVLLLPRLRRRHGLSEDETLEFVVSLLPDSLLVSDPPPPSPRLTRDLSDTKFLALAAAAHADYLVTNDRRHLLRVRAYRGVRIVTPGMFLRELPDGGER